MDTLYLMSFLVMLRLTLSLLVLFTLSVWADDLNSEVRARLKALVPPAGQPAATYPAPAEDWMPLVAANLDKLKQGPYDMIFDGDAITEGWETHGADVLKQRFGNLKVLDVAIHDDQVQHALWLVQHGEIEGQNPKLVMLLIGTSNLLQPPENVAAGIKLLIGEYERRWPNAHILLMGLFPRQQEANDAQGARVWIKAVNAIISTYSSDPKVIYMNIGDKLLQPDGTISADIMPDFLHPSAKGYAIWADAIQPVIDTYFPNAATK
jgi:lysophospholipase L1-like esterase